MSRETLISIYKAMSAASRIASYQAVHHEPWDYSDKKPLLDCVDDIDNAFRKEEYSTVVNLYSGTLLPKLLDIVKSEYGTRLGCIVRDTQYLKNTVSDTANGGSGFIRFTNIDYVLGKAKELSDKVAGVNQGNVADFISDFYDVHDDHYYGQMVDNFISAVLFYVELAKTKKMTDDTKILWDMVTKCNRPNKRYEDHYNLRMFTDRIFLPRSGFKETTQEVVNRIIRNIPV
jgi:hypothetical protein